MKVIKGEIISMVQNGDFDVLVHGCNCFNNMNVGFSKQIKKEFPVSSLADGRTGYGKKYKLGTYSGCTVNLREYDYRINKKILILNAYIQYTLGDGATLNYLALSKVFQKIKKEFTGKKIAFPLIGLGLKNFSASKVCEIIDQELDGEDYSLVVNTI